MNDNVNELVSKDLGDQAGEKNKKMQLMLG